MDNDCILITNINEENLNNNIDEERNYKTSKIQTIISVLKGLKISIGMDVSSAPVPGSLISPFSSLSYSFDTFANNFEILISANENKNDLDRLLNVYKYLNTVFMINNDQFSKPLVPIIGETQMSQFQVSLNGELNTDNYYCVEHIQNNPPLSLCCIYNKKEGIKVYFNHGIKILFMGTYFKVGFEGAECYIEFEKYNEKYTLEIPPLCTRFLRGFSEYCGIGKVNSNKSKYSIIANYYAKPLFGGKYNYCESKVIENSSNNILFKISGCWDNELYITDLNIDKTDLFFKRPNQKYIKINSNNVLPTDSNKIWKGVIDAHELKNNNLKIREKNKVEDEQKRIENEKKKNNIEFKPIHFKKVYNSNENIHEWKLINFN